MKLGLVDNCFIHHGKKSSLSSFPGHQVFPKYFEWDRENICDITFFTDNNLHEAKKHSSKIKIAWILEPRALVPSVYDYVEKNHEDFDYILTHDVDWIDNMQILGTPEKVRYTIFGGNWISEEDWKIYSKTKNICIIASHKRQLPGHKLRHEIIEKLSGKYNIDVLGNGYMPFDKTVDVLKDYRFCIVVENISTYGWHTEKLWSPMACGTIPIYCGDPLMNISLVRNQPLMDMGLTRIPEFRNIKELERTLSWCNEDWYDSNDGQILIQENFQCFEEYSVTENWMWEKILKDLV